MATAAFAGGCTFFTGGSVDGAPSSTDVAAFQKVYMSSYFAERGGAPLGLAGRALTPFLRSGAAASRATVPVGLLTTVAFGSLAPARFSNYPEPGQTTAFTATLVAGTPTGTRVYDVTATTTYPASDIRNNYVEEYYVQDVGLNGPGHVGGWNTGTTFDGIWSVDDPIVKQDAGVWVLGTDDYFHHDQTARLRQVLTFADGTSRAETIFADSNSGGSKFDPAPFDITGSLDLSDAFIPGAPTTVAASDVLYSSIVIYNVTPSTNPNFWFWQGSVPQAIVGIRYYTEVRDTAANTYTAYTASFEKTVSTLTTTGGGFATTVAGVYVGSSYDALAESVLRQKVVYGLAPSLTSPTGIGAMTTNMKSRVVNITGLKDFYLTQINSEEVQLSQATSTIYKPTGNADAILAGNPAAFVFTRTQQVTPAAGTLPFAISNATLSGAGALATVYTAITEQTATTPATGAPASNLLGTGGGVLAAFNGQQSMGTAIPSAAATVTNTMGTKGYVEAWIYMNSITDTAGIVHKGTLADFSDECFSLQGWSTSGQVMIALDYPGGGNSYDGVWSTYNLNAKAWYHLVATWDTTAGASSYIRLYINGVLNNSAKPSVAAYRQNTSGVMVGSQISSSYNASWGYFGLNGKIAGANVGQAPLTARQILDRYNASLGSTSGW
jgi:hypothetical protein